MFSIGDKVKLVNENTYTKLNNMTTEESFEVVEVGIEVEVSPEGGINESITIPDSVRVKRSKDSKPISHLFLCDDFSIYHEKDQDKYINKVLSGFLNSH